MSILRDTHVHQGARRKLVELLRQKGIRSVAVLDAIGRVPRHLFIDDTAFERLAYEDIPFPIGHEQTISQPYTVARQSELLEAQPGDKVLEIGTGCGYQTAVLCAMGLRPYSIERIRPLHARAKVRLAAMDYRPQLFFGDGFKGAPAYAPFDRVLVTCGAPQVPEEVLQQVRVGGRVVLPIGAGDVQTMVVLQRRADGGFDRSEHGRFRFVPMLNNKVG